MSSKLSALASIGTGQAPTDLYYIDDVSAGAAGSKSITGDSLFAFPTRNITDGVIRFQAFAAPAVSGAAQGAIYFDSATNRLLFSENAGAYVRVGNVTGPATATDEALARFDAATGRLLQDSAITLSDAGALTFPDNIRQTFNPGATVAGLNVGSLAGDPSTPINGDLWYDSTGNLLRARVNGATITVGNVTGPASATDEAIARFDAATGKLIQNSNVTISDTGVFTFPDGVRQTFNPDATTPGFNVGSQAGDPSTPINGDIWYDSTGNLLRARINGATVSLGAGGGGTPGGLNTQVQYNNAGAFGGVSGATSNGTNMTFGSQNLIATSPIIGTGINDTNGNEQVTFSVAASAVNNLNFSNAATGVGVTLSAVGDDANIVLLLSPKGTSRLESTGPLRLSGTGTDTYTTPAASGVPTKINIPNFDPGSFGQIVAMGITSAVGANRRVFSLFDQRSGAHQPTIGVFTPDETALFGISWEGSNSEVSLKTTVTDGVVRMQAGDTGTARLMVIAPGVTYTAQAGIKSSAAGLIPFIVSAAASPSVDIAQFIINDNNAAGTYTGVAKGGTLFTPRNVVTGTGTQNLDFSLGNVQQFTFGAGNATFTFSNIPNSAKLTIVIIQDGTGGRTLTWPGTAKFIGGTAPTLSAGANARDIINFYSDGTNIYQTSAIALAVA